MRLIHLIFIIVVAVFSGGGLSTAAFAKSISLAGKWQFLRGGPDLASHPGEMPAVKFADTITLPGTTDTNHKGPGDNWPTNYSLTQPWQFIGTCWYARDVVIPQEWQNQHVTLHLERTKYTQCWIDGRLVGDNPLCCTPQEYDLGNQLSPGPHRLMIAVDNKRIPPVGADAHQFSGSTQGNWNGIVGKIELRATSLSWISDVQVYPNAQTHAIDVRVRLTSADAQPGEAMLATKVIGPGVATTATQSASVKWAAGESVVRLQLALGPAAEPWDEFHPALHVLGVHLTGPGIDDQQQVTFGLRTFAAHGQQFTINGRPVFLRGKHDACVFPLTGHPPMEVDGWLKYLRTCQSYGLNHIRFHTWTPPEAAFTAADQLGMYLQPELPFWGTFDQKVKEALEPEAIQILRRFGNHPSFVMFSMGNEHWAGADVLASLVGELKAFDNRHLYVRGTNAFSYLGRPGIGDDYLITADAKGSEKGPILPVRGANTGVDPRSHVQFGPADTMTDYSSAIAGSKVPIVTHEMGQYTIYPNYKEIDKYTGVSRAHNLESFRDDLKKAGMADQDAAFALASGKLAALCYREEIESCLRTPNYGGFELLDLQDYPGQGTAPVGILDSFMDSKGVITPAQWRDFCSPIVLLARFSKYAWTTDETFEAMIEVAQYGEQNLPATQLKWWLTDAAGRSIRTGEIATETLLQGNVRPIGKLSIPLTELTTPAELRLHLSLVGTPVSTSYPLWVYPPKADVTPPPQVQIARTFDASAQATLAAGGRVLLICDRTRPLANTVGGGFATDFWGVTFFHNKPGTMGLLCDPKSPALSEFPTEAYSNWQWFNLLIQAQPLILDSLYPDTDRPIVQIIDNYERCHLLGLVFEAVVGKGKLLVCATDLLDLVTTQPQARQLLTSLNRYAGSDRFVPKTSISVEKLRALLETKIDTTGAVATASSYDKGWQNYAPANLIDGNDHKAWMAAKDNNGECWCQVEFTKPTDIGSAAILWADPGPGIGYTIERSSDGDHWNTILDRRHRVESNARQRFDLDAKAVRFIRVVITGTSGGKPAAINEIQFYPPPATKAKL